MHGCSHANKAHARFHKGISSHEGPLETREHLLPCSRVSPCSVYKHLNLHQLCSWCKWIQVRGLRLGRGCRVLAVLLPPILLPSKPLLTHSLPSFLFCPALLHSPFLLAWRTWAFQLQTTAVTHQVLLPTCAKWHVVFCDSCEGPSGCWRASPRRGRATLKGHFSTQPSMASVAYFRDQELKSPILFTEAGKEGLRNTGRVGRGEMGSSRRVAKVMGFRAKRLSLSNSSPRFLLLPPSFPPTRLVI